MVATTGELQRERLLELAEDYRSKGYEVAFQPRNDTLPDFLKAYRPDMLAFGSDESVVVEVKARPLAKSDSEYLQSLAQTIKSHPGWRFELVVLAPEGNREDLGLVTSSQKSFKVRDIQAGLQFARNSVVNQLESALLYAWSWVEAILRLLAEKEEVSLKSFDARYLIKMLVVEGVISRSDYQMLISILPLRNAAAHGFKVDELNANQVYELVNLAEDLLSLLSSDEAVG
ncbi:MAG: hypothetical protein WBG38_10385 [Nodosilinea sp.]